MKYKKEILIIIILIAIAAITFFVLKEKKQPIDNGGVVAPSSQEDTIYFDENSGQWKDEYGVCNTCTVQNGFSDDGLILVDLEKDIRLCYANRELSGLSGDQLGDVYNYNFLELVREGESVRGNAEFYPYGIDSSMATFEGQYYSDKFEAKLLMNLSAEGQNWKEEQLVVFTEKGAQSIYTSTSVDADGVYRIADGSDRKKGFIFKQVDCNVFDEMQNESGYADVLVSIEPKEKTMKFEGKIIEIENGRDGYTVLLENKEGEKKHSTLSIPNLGIDSKFDFDNVKIGTTISVEGDSFTLGDDEFITAKKANLVDGYVGKTRKEASDFAKKNKVPFRVVSIDGKHLPTTRDYRPGRINASVIGDIVTSYFVEGRKRVLANVEKPVVEDFIGLSEKEAKNLAEKHSIVFRLIQIDDKLLGMTMDFRPGRMNAILKGGRVSSISVEGDFDDVQVLDFNQCLVSGGIVTEIYPRQCEIGAKVFTELLDYIPEEVFVPTSKRKILNIGPKREECVGAFPQQCYIVDGNYFYDGINGFDYEPGYNYVIEVEVRPRCDTNKPDTCPLDVGINSYHFVKLISKNKK